ncbi:hypothetical protein BS78_K178500 [Paspalum vaginatum]|uniref:Late embryogenesis abundant protein LEA-2 subgroup domain-containing protein n=1 Tax=Paspalum vaginatum TaxID=158149 RepID=A0A9W7XB22_9POAL|nr:hypothetical protein BS78_K178500 [Paspalum vaginatum]
MSGGEGACVCCVCVGIVGVLVLIITLCVRAAPDPLIFFPSVENGTLYTLDMDNSTSTLTYNLSAVFSFSCVNGDGSADGWRLKATKVAVAMFYSGQTLGPGATSLPAFQPDYSKAAMVPLQSLQGRQPVAGTAVVEAYAEDAAQGYYSIEAKLKLSAGYKRDFSCTLYFEAPVAARGAPNPTLFDGNGCWEV